MHRPHLPYWPTVVSAETSRLVQLQDTHGVAIADMRCANVFAPHLIPEMQSLGDSFICRDIAVPLKLKRHHCAKLAWFSHVGSANQQGEPPPMIIGKYGPTLPRGSRT